MNARIRKKRPARRRSVAHALLRALNAVLWAGFFVGVGAVLFGGLDAAGARAASGLRNAAAHATRVLNVEREVVHARDVLELRAQALSRSVEVTASFGATRNLGSGVVLGRQGSQALVLTNAHVVQSDGKPAGRVQVRSSGGRLLRAALIEVEHREAGFGGPVARDYALLAVSDPGKTLGEPVEAVASPKRVGDWVLCIGSPLGHSFYEDDGYIVQINADGSFMSDCTGAPGSSGGPVFDSSGALLGVNTFQAGDDRGHMIALGVESLGGIGTPVSEISATASWQPTGVEVAPGAALTVVALGTWNYGGPGAIVDASGSGESRRRTVDASHRHAALICRIGDDGETFAVGGRPTGAASRGIRMESASSVVGGDLSCRSNDDNPDNNQGSLTLVTWLH